MPAFWDTPYRLMITHTSDSHQIPSQNKSKLQSLKKSLFNICSGNDLVPSGNKPLCEQSLTQNHVAIWHP